MNKSKSLRISLLVLLIASAVYALSLWLTRPSLVYESYREVTSVLGSTPGEVTPAAVTPVSEEFSLIIPQLQINVPVIANVDGGDPSEYLWRVTQGVAHYKHREFTNITVDGALPGEGGNIFLFGHSQIPGGDMSNYQGVFNGLHKLIPGDGIEVFYEGGKYQYEVSGGKVVSKKALEYLEPTEEETLTLMTCWPLGLDVQRYIIRAKRK